MTGEVIEGLKRVLIGESPVEKVVPLEDLTKPVEEAALQAEETISPLEEKKEELPSLEEAPKVMFRRDLLPIPFKIPPDTEGLSDIEIRLFELIDGKKTASELARELGLDPRTIQIYLKKFVLKEELST